MTTKSAQFKAPSRVKAKASRNRKSAPPPTVKRLAGANWSQALAKQHSAGPSLKKKKADKRNKRPAQRANFPRGRQAPVPATPQDESVETDALTQEIAAFAAFVALTPMEKRARAMLVQDVKELVQSSFRDSVVQLYGSSSSGLDTFRSDLDLTVGNISLSKRQQQPLGDVFEAADDEELSDAKSTDEKDDESAQQEEEEEEEDYEDDKAPSFSLNLALPGSPSGTDKHSYRTPDGKSPWNPTQRRRKVQILRALQQLLLSERPHLQVKCLQKARIPILMVRDPKTQLCMDLGVNSERFEHSDHGRTTTLVTQLQQALGPSFSALVVFLKEFLHQFDLDKPFTGGLGSFRLYIMIATVCAKSGRKPAAVLLLRFFQLYGNKKQPDFLHANTRLSLPFVQGGDDCVVDFSSVFRLDDCVDHFAMAYDILSKTQKLGSIIYEDKLSDERRASKQRIRDHVPGAAEPPLSSSSSGPVTAQQQQRRRAGSFKESR